MHPAGHPEVLARGDFAFDINLRGWVFAHKNGGKSGPDALRMELGDLAC